MQLAGVPCVLYRQNVLIETDATWCARCSSVLHGACLTQANEQCPTCRQAYDRPERYFVFSQVCPECSQPNQPPQPQCTACSARTRWDTQAAYDAFKAHMKDTARVYGLRGIAEVAAGGACLVATLLTLFALRRVS